MGALHSLRGRVFLQPSRPQCPFAFAPHLPALLCPRCGKWGESPAPLIVKNEANPALTGLGGAVRALNLLEDESLGRIGFASSFTHCKNTKPNPHPAKILKNHFAKCNSRHNHTTIFVFMVCGENVAGSGLPKQDFARRQDSRPIFPSPNFLGH